MRSEVDVKGKKTLPCFREKTICTLSELSRWLMGSMWCRPLADLWLSSGSWLLSSLPLSPAEEIAIHVFRCYPNRSCLSLQLLQGRKPCTWRSHLLRAFERLQSFPEPSKSIAMYVPTLQLPIDQMQMRQMIVWPRAAIWCPALMLDNFPRQYSKA